MGFHFRTVQSADNELAEYHVFRGDVSEHVRQRYAKKITPETDFAKIPGLAKDTPDRLARLGIDRVSQYLGYTTKQLLALKREGRDNSAGRLSKYEIKAIDGVLTKAGLPPREGTSAQSPQQSETETGTHADSILHLPSDRETALILNSAPKYAQALRTERELPEARSVLERIINGDTPDQRRGR